MTEIVKSNIFIILLLSTISTDYEVCQEKSFYIYDTSWNVGVSN